MLVWSARDAAENLSKSAKVRVIDPNRPRSRRIVFAKRGITDQAEVDAIVQKLTDAAVAR